MSRVLALLLAVLLAACATAVPPVALSPAALPTAIATASPTPVPTLAPEIVDLLGLLEAHDAALASGDATRIVALLATDTPLTFRAHEVQLGEAIAKRHGAPPARELVTVGRLDDFKPIVEVVERDDQGRERRVRYFVSQVGRTALTEPTIASLGPPTTTSTARADIQARAIDAPQARTIAALVEDVLAGLVARLGEAYAPSQRITIECEPVFVEGLPPFASAFVDGATVHMLTSQSMIVSDGPGAAWSRTVLTHELSHVLLFQRGDGPFVLVEGIPLYLTGDLRKPELDRIVAAGTLWDLDHLVRGNRDQSEFFAAYAQAGSFIRFLAARYGERALLRWWETSTGRSYAEPFVNAFGTTLQDAYTAWRASLAR